MFRRAKLTDNAREVIEGCTQRLSGYQLLPRNELRDIRDRRCLRIHLIFRLKLLGSANLNIAQVQSCHQLNCRIASQPGQTVDVGRVLVFILNFKKGSVYKHLNQRDSIELGPLCDEIANTQGGEIIGRDELIAEASKYSKNME